MEIFLAKSWNLEILEIWIELILVKFFLEGLKCIFEEVEVEMEILAKTIAATCERVIVCDWCIKEEKREWVSFPFCLERENVIAIILVKASCSLWEAILAINLVNFALIYYFHLIYQCVCCSYWVIWLQSFKSGKLIWGWWRS